MIGIFGISRIISLKNRQCRYCQNIPPTFHLYDRKLNLNGMTVKQLLDFIAQFYFAQFSAIKTIIKTRLIDK